MIEIFKFINTPHDKKSANNYVDNLNGYYSVLLISIFVMVSGLHAYIGSPIKCWCPAHFTGSHVKYTDSFCWVQNTYYLDVNQTISQANKATTAIKQTLQYYQWIPFIFAFQALMFYIPMLIWQTFNTKNGIDVDDVIKSCTKLQTSYSKNDIDRVALQINKYRSFQKNFKANIITSTKDYSLFALYIFQKCLQVVNLLCQVFLIQWIFSVNFLQVGYNVLSRLLTNTSFEDMGINIKFPRVTYCNLQVRLLGNVAPYTVQCSLPVNLYAQVMYILFWFWVAILLFFTIMDLSIWISRIVLMRRESIMNGLQCVDQKKNLKKIEIDQDSKPQPAPSSPEDEYPKYVKSLSTDEIFILCFIKSTTNSLIAKQINNQLFKLFKKN
ncbi:hypothetical protein A3Q56_05360 [Intoshia linei]|uniref:Innexin n=1 Tax=Intoshia linei TaxID=1819745 RepID=A0A177AYH6_9BILA|nr:hypothetical protein A3Q56_05360 [Intoshia linei]